MNGNDRDVEQRHQETKKPANVTGSGETSESSPPSGADLRNPKVGTQDGGSFIGGAPAGGIAGTGGVSTTDVGQRGPGKSIDSVR